MNKDSQCFQEGLGEHLSHQLNDQGILVEQHLRHTDKGIFITEVACNALNYFPHPDDPFVKVRDSLEGVGFERNGVFRHPLMDSVTGVSLNSWGSACVLVSLANKWVDDKGSAESYQSLQVALSAVGRGNDLDRLLWLSRFNDSRLLELIGAASEGISILLGGKDINITSLSG